MVVMSLDVLLAALVLATTVLFSVYGILTYSGIYRSAGEYLTCLSKAVRYSDFFLHTRDGVALTRSNVLVYGRVDCGKLPLAYEKFNSRGFSARVCCGSVCAGSDADYVVTLQRTVYWPDVGIVPFVLSVCLR